MNGSRREASASRGSSPRKATKKSGRVSNKNTLTWNRKQLRLVPVVAVAVAAFATTTQTWLHVGVEGQTVKTPDVNVPGSEAATAVTALALVALAGALAASIAGRIARVLTAVLIFGAGVGILASGIAVVVDPQSAASASIAEAVGVIGGNPHNDITALPMLAAVAGGLLALSAVYMLIAARAWPTSKRFEKPGAQVAAGTEPDEDRGPAGGNGAVAPPDRDEPDDADDEFDEIDGWDRLSKGQDPTT